MVRRCGTPVTAAQVTPEMLAPVRRAADGSGLPQTVWPSCWVGSDFQGADCLLTWMAAALHDGRTSFGRPADAAAGAGPILTVLPAAWAVEPAWAAEVIELTAASLGLAAEEVRAADWAADLVDAYRDPAERRAAFGAVHLPHELRAAMGRSLREAARFG